MCCGHPFSLPASGLSIADNHVVRRNEGVVVGYDAARLRVQQAALAPVWWAWYVRVEAIMGDMSHQLRFPTFIHVQNLCSWNKFIFKLGTVKEAAWNRFLATLTRLLEHQAAV
jgi:hypothetical protein